MNEPVQTEQGVIILQQLEQACDNNDHELVKDLLASIESAGLKKEAFQQLIDYYGKKARFPVGYLLLFMEWLIKIKDFTGAMKQILKCREMGVDDARLSLVIFEKLIKPNEAYYKERVNKNLLLLREHKILFFDQACDFEQIKKAVTIIANYQPTARFNKLLDKESKGVLLVDIMNIKVISKLLEKGNRIYLGYEDIKKYYYLLLFEDLSQLSQYMEKKQIIFIDMEEKYFKKLFSNMLVVIPAFVLDLSASQKYGEIIKGITEYRSNNISAWSKFLDAYYKNLDHEYYKTLFSRAPSDVRILLVTSDVHTEVNRFIARNWYAAFLELGYQAKLITDSEPYEKMNELYIYKAIYEYKPDIVFNINHPVSMLNVMKDDREAWLRKNLLWIMRYRDIDYFGVSLIQPGYYSGNMFVLPMYHEQKNDPIKAGMPEDRIFISPDGVNINIFGKKDRGNSKYTCDITCVNNAVGAEILSLNYYLAPVKGNAQLEKLLQLLFDALRETVDDNEVFLPLDITGFVEKKLIKSDISLTDIGKRYLINFAAAISNALVRRKYVEWIIDSKITGSIKFWGRHWSNDNKFKDFHMGIAEHGEELASIYENSKISISDIHTTHERNFEILASGGFPLIRYQELPYLEESAITKYFRENEEVVLFYSKDDLLNKIQNYLDHPEERERIAGNGRKKVIEDFSHIAIVKKTMEYIKNFYCSERHENR